MAALRGLSGRVAEFVVDGINYSVFAVLDIVDQLLCPVFALLDSLLDSELTTCYCHKHVLPDTSSCISPLLSSTQELNRKEGSVLERWRQASDTVYASERRAGRRLHIVPLHRVLRSADANSLDASDSRNDFQEATEGEDCEQRPTGEEGRVLGQKASLVSKIRSKLRRGLSCISSRSCRERRVARWSDCGCEKCTSWQLNDQHLFVHLDDEDFVASPGIDGHVQSAESNVIFLHGFLSSSSFWTDTVMPALPQNIRASHRLFAVDILGFGKSPKPANSFYTLADHVDIIKRSLLEPNGVQKFHLVAHSMGCVIALALAAHFPAAVKSITLLAPPYFPATPGITRGIHTMQQVAPRKIWPLLSFGSAVMSWYEHIGRVACLVICKNHRIWEPFLYILLSIMPGHRLPLSSVADLTQHTHHSAWHLFHNTICYGAQAADYCFQVLLNAGLRVRVIHGTWDSVIPFKQSEMLSRRHANVVLTPVLYASHASIVFGRESDFGLALAEEFKLAETSSIRQKRCE